LSRRQGSVSALLRLEAGRVLSNGADHGKEADDGATEGRRSDSDDDDHEFCGDHVDDGLNEGDDGGGEDGEGEDRLHMFRSASRASVSAFSAAADYDLADDSESVLVEVDTLGAGDFFGFLPAARGAAERGDNGDEDEDGDSDDDSASVSQSSSSSSQRVGRLPRVARSSYSAFTASECEIWAVRADAMMDALEEEEEAEVVVNGNNDDTNPRVDSKSAASSSSSSSSGFASAHASSPSSTSASSVSVLNRLRAHLAAQCISERAVRRALLRGMAWSEYRSATAASASGAASASANATQSQNASMQAKKEGNNGGSASSTQRSASSVSGNQSSVPPPAHVMAAGESAQVCAFSLRLCFKLFYCFGIMK
jgi:CRP-like cAMP-binding protein